MLQSEALGSELPVAWALALEALVSGVLACRSVGSALPLAVLVYQSAELAYPRSPSGPGRSAAR